MTRIRTDFKHFPKRAVACLLTLALPIFAFTAHAQGCPPGTYPWSGSGVFTCLPDSNYRQQQTQQPQQSTNPPRAQWQSRWGAIATDGNKGVLGSAKDMKNEKDAIKAAIASCQSKGGADCQVDISYSNGCAAMVIGDKGYGTDSAQSVDEAVKKATNTCGAKDTNCHVYFTECSQAVTAP